MCQHTSPPHTNYPLANLFACKRIYIYTQRKVTSFFYNGESICFFLLITAKNIASLLTYISFCEINDILQAIFFHTLRL